MGNIQQLLEALEDRSIAHAVGIAHDAARANYPLASNTVQDYDQFTRILGDYYAYHYGRCVGPGARLSLTEAAGQAKELLEAPPGQRHQDLNALFLDAKDGTNGGMRHILDQLCEGLKAQSAERYVRSVFERHVAPNSWEQKVDIIRQFIAHNRVSLPAEVRNSPPERYAQNYQGLIRAFVDGLGRASSFFRQL